MIGTARIIVEEQAVTGQEPSKTIDTTADYGAPTFSDVAAVTEKRLSIGPSVIDTAVVIPDSCMFLLVSDQPVKVQVGATDALEHMTRFMAHVGDDEVAIAFKAATIYLSGNASTTADVRILYWETVD